MNTRSMIISSLEKVFHDSHTYEFKPLKNLSALKGERISFQVMTEPLVLEERIGGYALKPVIEGALAPYVTVRDVNEVPVDMPSFPGSFDDGYLRTEPGLYPDVLTPLHYEGHVTVKPTATTAVWCEINIPKDTELVGVQPLTFSYLQGENTVFSETLNIEIINATLPEQTMYLTQWFHCDGLAQYYRVPVWSEEHWRIVENFARVAVKNGINLLLTPVFTPELDTAIGRERLTTQLVGVTVTEGKYSFDFSLVDRWIEMCDRVGIKYFEIAHLFSQWGAKFAPKVMATVDGEYRRIFGWETCSTGEEYSSFIRQFLTEFIEHMKARGDDKRCLYHISDEPNITQIDDYKAAKAVVEDLLEGYIIMDALSNYDFYANGILSTPIPSNNHITPFIENKVENLWTYYCCSQYQGVSNRFIAMNSWRNRSIGYQFFKYDIVGFLQWGYNFYNNMSSFDPINPYLTTSGDCRVPSGDPFSVYPADDGDALESLRIIVFHEALEDYSAMKLAAELYSKEEVVKAIEDILGYEITFSRCADSADIVLRIRSKINEMIKAKV